MAGISIWDISTINIIPQIENQIIAERQNNQSDALFSAAIFIYIIKENFIMNKTVSDKKTSIPITSVQAFECLYININNRVPSILTSGFYFGTDLDLPRVEEILKNSESSNKLFLSDILGGELRHDITAWDQKYEKWAYFECLPEKVELLKKTLTLKIS
jgi:hypothetical protein